MTRLKAVLKALSDSFRLVCLFRGDRQSGLQRTDAGAYGVTANAAGLIPDLDRQRYFEG
jgi:hypothetical protein